VTNPHSRALYREAQRRYRKEERLLKMLEGLSVVPLTTYPGQLGYTVLYLGNLRSVWDLWWLLPEGVANRGGKHRSLACYSLSQLGGYRERKAAPAAACHVKHLDWRVGARVVTYWRVVWEIDSSVPYESPGMGGIFLALLQEGQVPLSLPWSRFSCLPSNRLRSSHMAPD
jgi:hypothetical protein